MARPGPSLVPHCHVQLPDDTIAAGRPSVERVSEILTTAAQWLGSSRNAKGGRIRFRRFGLLNWLMNQEKPNHLDSDQWSAELRNRLRGRDILQYGVPTELSVARIHPSTAMRNPYVEEPQHMGKVFVTASVSLDGFIADDKNTVGPLFDWLVGGEVEIAVGNPHAKVHVSPDSAGYIRSDLRGVRAVVAGRRLFDFTNGWNGEPPAGDHVFVVTHEPPTTWEFPDAPLTFVTDGIASAIEKARAFAGDGDVSVTAGDVGGQAVDAGLVDEVHLDLVPVLFGTGRPFFGAGIGSRLMLENPRITEGDRVLHLRYPVRRS